MEDLEEAVGFPWKAKSFKEALGSKLMKQDGSLVGLEAIEGKTPGTLFQCPLMPTLPWIHSSVERILQ